MKKQPLFNRHAAGPPVGKQQFSGRGFIPDVMSEHAPTMLAEASRTLLEDGFVTGKDGMYPVGGSLGRTQKGQPADSGAGGAGSFAQKTAYGARG